MGSVWSARLAVSAVLALGAVGSSAQSALAAPISTATGSSVSPQLGGSPAPIGAAANADDPTAIGFDEFSLGTTITDQYASRGVVFTSGVFTSSDIGSPTAPVLSGTPKFFGEIAGRFVVPGTTTPTTVAGFSLDVGFIDDRNSVEIDYYDASGNLVGSTRAQSFGINEIDVDYRGIASFKVRAVEYEAAGFAIDNLIVRTAATGVKPTRMAELGDSYSSGEGLLSGDGLEYDCGTDLQQGLYRQGTTLPAGVGFWSKWSCQTETGSRTPPAGVLKRPLVKYRNLCHRHGRAYPNQIRERLGITAQNSIFVACSGATTANVGVGVGVTPAAQYPDPESPPGVHGGQTQFQNVSDFAKGGPPDLITIGIGGNDAEFAKIVTECVTGTCTDSDFASRTLATINGAMFDNVRTTLKGLKAAFPTTTIVAFGYPSVVDDPNRTSCAGVIGINSDELSWLKYTVLSAINESIKDAATEAGVAYADISAATNGHGVCSADPWINGLRLDIADRAAARESFHPNQKAHDAIAGYFIDHYTDGSGRLLLRNPAAARPIRPPGGAGIVLGDLAAGAVRQCGAGCLQPAACVQVCSVYVQGSGFTPGATMGVTLQSDPVELGQVTADASGRVEAGFAMPAGIEPGIHTVTLDGMANGTRQHAVQLFRVFGRVGSFVKTRFAVTAKGALVRALAVRRLAPESHVDVICAKGGKAAEKALAGRRVRRAGGCPFTHLAFTAKAGKRAAPRALGRRFKAVLAPGIVIRVVVTHSGEGGRTLDALIRRGKAPKLVKRCTDPGSIALVGC